MDYIKSGFYYRITITKPKDVWYCTVYTVELIITQSCIYVSAGLYFQLEILPILPLTREPIQSERKLIFALKNKWS